MNFGSSEKAVSKASSTTTTNFMHNMQLHEQGIINVGHGQSPLYSKPAYPPSITQATQLKSRFQQYSLITNHQEMAEGVLFDIAARIIESLGSLALKEIGLLWGVTDDLEKLKNTVSTIQAVLLDAEEQWAVNREVKDWLEKLKDVVYDVDDLLDGFSTECLLREMMTGDKMAKKVRIFFSKSNQLVYDFKMGREIKEIRQKLDAIKNDRKFHLEQRPVEIGVRARRRDDTHSYVPAAKVTGREDDKKEIIKRLLSDSENVEILPITGIGGLGKTTLAQFIFNDEEIDKHFQLKMWACVSESFEVEKVVGKILESVTKKKPEFAGMDTLVHDLRKEIGGKKYLLVLDDVWNEDVKKWDDLKVLLEVGASGSRILITTRSKKVAQITQTIAEYSLQCLDERESWCLFKQVAFENGQVPVNSREVEVGKEIVEKCSGVPLVIKTIGRLLSLENFEEGWVSFKNNKLQKIKENDILPTLKLSYDQLPSHLKQCFAYCSIFPKDYVMEKSKLINLWIAQGFIKLSNQNESCLEDVGHEYFMDLLWRSFFQDAEMDDLGNVITSKMHDLMHDLAMSVAGPLITKLESKEKTIGDQKIRHVSVVNNIDFSIEIPTSSTKASRIRTLLSLGGFKDLKEVSSTSCEAIFSNLKFLRVLDLNGRDLDLPSSICKLKHLRNLDLSQNWKIEKLPDSISRLQNLYSLRLSGCRRLKELPRGITKLVNLRHLYNDECYSLTYMPRGLGQLKNLQTLSKFVVNSDAAPKDSGRLSELNTLNSLRGELQILDLRHGEDVTLLDYKGANLKEKEHLQVLALMWSGKNEENMALEGLEPHPNLKKLSIGSYWGVKLSEKPGFSSLTNLVDLELSYCRKLKYLPPLSRLPSLKRLSLFSLDEIEYVSDCSDNNEFSFSSSAFFPSLQKIWINDCRKLKGWWRRSDSYNVDVNTTDHALLLFPRLSELIILRCPMLTSLPMFPHLEEELYLHIASWKPVQQTITNASSSSASSTPIAFSSAPLSKLKKITLEQIEDLETLPEDGLQNLISLQQLTIVDCQRLKSLSQGVQYLTALQNLELTDCPLLDLGNDEHGMQWKGLKSLISLKFKGIPKLVSLPSGLQHVTTLRELQISDCLMLDLGNNEHGMQWKGLKSLISLKFKGIPKLVSLPSGLQHVTTLRELQISDCPMLDIGNNEHGMQWKGLKSLISLKFSGMPKLVSLPLGLQYVTTLRELHIIGCSSLVAIPEWICNWASLEQFTIFRCSGLTSLPEAMSRLTTLRELRISNCPVLDLGNGMQWKGLKSLISLDFDSIPNLVSLPLGLQHVTSLRWLQISDCSSLLAIPEWIYNWASLEQFTISGCSGLTSLPEAMSSLTSLKTLEIQDCPILLRRCELGGEDRPKIAHIPKLDFRLRP
ncbi:disease resistance protein RGA2-like isoform X2 [Carya illinoinensis]|uniref:disease resistance protein RGA2-like isoform X2 n=1 Tax=Carya illinoinensis TaxID=32201 RepID=UPI001C726AC9|nr:disease resistance protein RGA2-like isoform X2 [Carya illinoinensis]